MVSLLVLLFINAQGQNRQWTHIYIPNINCQKTTESREDEIYLIVTWKTSYGSTGTVRVPSSEHWDMNDGIVTLVIEILMPSMALCLPTGKV